MHSIRAEREAGPSGFMNNGNQTTEGFQENPGTIVCPSCTEQQAEGPHFCVKCGAPLTAFSTIGPFERIHAQGYAFRQAASGPARRIILIGLWVLVVPQVYSVASHFGWQLGRNPEDLMTAAIVAGLIGLYVALLCRVTVNYIRKSKPKE